MAVIIRQPLRMLSHAVYFSLKDRSPVAVQALLAAYVTRVAGDFTATAPPKTSAEKMTRQP